MVDIAITAANVAPTASTQRLTKIAAAAITAGQAVYVNASDRLALADADLSATAAAAVGIALNNAAANQPCSYAVGGDVTINAVATVGTIYVLSGTAGGVAPAADLASGDFVTVLGVGKTTTSIQLAVNATGIEI
jgi:hypothetical protein